MNVNQNIYFKGTFSNSTGSVFKRTGLSNIIEKNAIYRPKFDRQDIPANLKMQEVNLLAADGKHSIKCYYKPPSSPDKPTLVYYHGAIYNASYYPMLMPDFIHNGGYGIFITEYRGYQEEHKMLPTEKTVYEDARTGLEFLKDKGIKPENMILWGTSMGGAVVTELASKQNFKGVIIDSTFTTMKNEIEDKFNERKIRKSYLSLANASLVSEFNNLSKLEYIKSPVLVLHSLQDQHIHYSHSQKIADKLSKTNKNTKLVLGKHQFVLTPHEYLDWKVDHVKDFVNNLEANG